MMNLMQDTREKIAKHRRAVIGVFPKSDSVDPTNEAFAYTIGNTDQGHPELLLVGMFGNDVAMTLNWLSDVMLARGEAFKDGQRYRAEGAKWPVAIFEASEVVKDHYTIQAGAYYRGNHRYRVMQVVLPDKNGRFPWDRACAEPYSMVRVLWKKVH